MRRQVASVFIRIPFQASDIDQYGRLALKMRYDDGFVAYLNGVEVARANAGGSAPLPWNENASASNPDAQAQQATSFDVSQHTHLLVEGENILAVHGLNFTVNSSDFLILPELDAIAIDDGDNDGLFDEWEFRYGLNPDDPSDAIADLDHDGMSSLQEFVAQTDPTDASSLLRIRSLRFLSSSELELTWDSVAGVVYQVEANEDLESNEWTPVASHAASADNTSLNIAKPASSDWYLRIAATNSVSNDN